MKRYVAMSLMYACLLAAGAFFAEGCKKSNPVEPATSSISGTVTDALTNNPISSATVTLGSSSTTTSATGNYSFSNVAPGTYTITASATNYVSASKQIQVLAGQPQTVNFSLQPASTTVSGTVVDAVTSTPVASATVVLGSRSTTTSSNGSYSFSQVQPGSYTMAVSASGYNSASKQISVSPGVPQIVDFSIRAVQETVNFGTTLNPNYYSWTSFSFDSYSFVQCSNGLMGHNVKVTVTVNPTPNPINVIVMRPDGFYKLEVNSVTAGFTRSFMSNACGRWMIVVENFGTAQTTYSGTVTMDFSHYSVSSNDISSPVQVPIDTSVAPSSLVYVRRFLKAGMTYNLQLTVSGTIYLTIKDPSFSVVLDNQKVDGTYTSQSFVATQDGLYWFRFENQNILFSKSISGSLFIYRGSSSGSVLQGEGPIMR